MGSLPLHKGWCVLVCVLCFCFSIVRSVNANVTVEGTVFIDRRSPIAVTDENFICATLDLWPPEKCNYGSCPWGNSSFLNLDLKNNLLTNAIKEFSPLMMRLGGTLQDRLIFQTEDSREPCDPTFVPNTSALYGFNEACLPLARWDELNTFLHQARAQFIFGLNALNGKTILPNMTAIGAWNYSNAEPFIRYTRENRYKVHGFELGNELGGLEVQPSFPRVAPGPYAKDTMALHRLIQKIYKRVSFKPLIMAPGGLFEESWYKEYIYKTPRSLNAITHHIYNVGGGDEEDLVEKILNATVLDSSIPVFKNLSIILKESGTSTVAWISESGGVYNSGRDGVTNTFVFSFWYLDILGIASTYDTKVYCRQTLVGGNYGLLDTTTFVPNPDYYSALLWHRLMGREVLSTRFEGTKNIRAYAHCAKKSHGITVLLINLDGNTTVKAKLNLKQLPGTTREEYHLTPMDGNIQSRTVLLNGKALTVTSTGAIPPLEPVLKVYSSKPITVGPHSIVFVHMPHVAVPACQKIQLIKIKSTLHPL